MNRFLIGNDIVIRIEPYQEWVSVKNSRVDTWAVARELIGFWAVARKLNGWWYTTTRHFPHVGFVSSRKCVPEYQLLAPPTITRYHRNP